MSPSKKCIDLIKSFEGYFPDSYLCPAGVPTIGYGSTMWMDGKKVQLGQKISLDMAEKLMAWELTNKGAHLGKLRLNQNQFDAIMSFVYNIGLGALLKSQLYKKALINSNDPTIRDEFMRWVNKGTPYQKGLTRRRKAEADLYFSKD